MTISMRHIKLKGDMIDVKKLERAIENALTGAAKDVKIDLSVTTQTWRHRPDFEIETSPGSRIIATDDEVYDFVDSGTKPHIITASSPFRPLVFGVGGSPKTTPRVIGSRAGTKGGTTVRAQVVHHPGTAPRAFSETIVRKWDDLLPDVIQRAIDATV